MWKNTLELQNHELSLPNEISKKPSLIWLGDQNLQPATYKKWNDTVVLKVFRRLIIENPLNIFMVEYIWFKSIT